MSIRTYIFALLTSLVLFIAVILSYQSGRLFISSFEMSIEKTLLDIGQEYPENGLEEQTILDYHVTTNWQKVPKPVRKRFPVIPTERNVHHSIFEDWVYIAPPGRAYSLLVTERDSQVIFVSRFNENIKEKIANDRHEHEFFIDPMVLVVLMGFAGILLFVFTLLFVFKKIALPVEQLQTWGKQLSLDDLDKPQPDFRFKELNDVASLIHSNLASVSDSIKREQVFLSYASHELRTPIAVLRSNTALLERVNPTPNDKEREIRNRIQRASLTMKSMTETLLWLSRKGDIEMPVELISLGSLLDNIVAELRYLLTGKSVEVNIDIDDSKSMLAVVPCTIVLNNLVRNAFQHTQQGEVNIVQRQNQVSITNLESVSDNINEKADELGFGLGMQLVEKLTQQFNWPMHITQDKSVYCVKIQFADNLSN